MSAVLHLTGGDHSGSDTFARYRYQAKITLLHWLGTLLEEGPEVVFAEHVEDLVLDYGGSQRFIQVKSRAAGQPLWRAGEMCDDGGGVDSLARAYSIARDLDCTFELHLEGGASPSGVTQAFVEDCSSAGIQLRKKITGHLKTVGLKATHLDGFLGRLRVVPRQASQDSVASHCLSAVVHLAPGLTGEDLLALCKALLDIVEHAQEAKHAGLAVDSTPADFLRAHLQCVLGIAQEQVDQDLAIAKRLTAERLTELLPVPPASEGLLFLRRQRQAEGVSALERKLGAAGATPGVIETAKALRAMAETRRLELLGGPDSLADQLEDLDNRVLAHAQAVALGYLDLPETANGIWRELVATAGLEDTDRNGLFRRDRQALVGLLCCISDECRFGWTPS